jgi:LAS superfamily LD-carboxypeptidase LdcB
MEEVGYVAGSKQPILLWSVGKGHMLRADAAAYFLAMREAAKEAGIELVVNSSFRSNDRQAALYAQYQKDLLDFIKKRRPTKPAPVAKPGYSNHQSGVAVDINRATGDNLATVEPDSPTDKWLAENASRFGFKRTVSVEPWHWEFFGAAI